MYICLCNPFSDQDVQDHLEKMDDTPARVKDVYSACSGGKDFCCGTCAYELRQMVDTHNNSRTIKQISCTLARTAKKLVHEDQA